MNDISCLILAGGQSKRFGENKALYIFEGSTILEIILDAALKISDDIAISVNTDNYKEFRPIINTKNKDIDIDKDIKLIPDDALCQLKGPLKGVFSSFKFLKRKYVLVIECDAPYFNINCANVLLGCVSDNISGVVPLWPDSTIEPLLACYNREETINILSILNEYALNLKSEYVFNDAVNIARILNNVHFYSIEDMIKMDNNVNPECFMNINDKKSLALFSEKFSEKIANKCINNNNKKYGDNYKSNNYKYDYSVMNGDAKTVKVLRRNKFFNFNKPESKPYGFTAKSLYYLTLYNQSKNKAYLNHFFHFLRKEEELYRGKGLNFMANKIKDNFRFYQNAV
jgi:molybdopterin-guanine dinucleotide biosynthesis protein A